MNWPLLALLALPFVAACVGWCFGLAAGERDAAAKIADLHDRYHELRVQYLITRDALDALFDADEDGAL